MLISHKGYMADMSKPHEVIWLNSWLNHCHRHIFVHPVASELLNNDRKYR